mmetsp:Transcript_20081/g.52246  ORF Transcript_20081/g.52246 Transcript_20081/m.52246 type:complete len:278 (-) Transcript_20081:1701-2534(-)
MLRQVLPEGGGDGHRVKHGIHSHVGHALLLVQWDAQLLKGAQQLGVHLIKALLFLLDLWLRVVGDALVVKRGVGVVAPPWLLHCQPLTEGLQAELQHPVRLVLLGTDGTHHILIQAFGEGLALNEGLEAKLVGAVNELLDVALLGQRAVLLLVHDGVHDFLSSWGSSVGAHSFATAGGHGLGGDVHSAGQGLLRGLGLGAHAPVALLHHLHFADTPCKLATENSQPTYFMCEQRCTFSKAFADVWFRRSCPPQTSASRINIKDVRYPLPVHLNIQKI